MTRSSAAHLLLGATLVLPCLRSGQVAQPLTGAPACADRRHGVCRTCRSDTPPVLGLDPRDAMLPGPTCRDEACTCPVTDGCRDEVLDRGGS